MFVLGPWLVKAPASSDSITPTERESIAHGLLWYMRYETIFCGMLLLTAVIYFPNAPPTAPSRSATAERIDFRKGLGEIAKAGGFWYCAMSYGMLTGFYGGWGSMLGPNLQQVLPMSTAQDDAGWIGFWGAVGGCAGGIALSIAADSMGGKMRVMLLTLCALAAGAFLIFALICDKTIPLSVPLLYGMSVLGGLFVNGTIPLFYELGVESAFPIAEGLSTSVLTLLNNFWCLVFLIVPVFVTSTAWMNWSIVIGAVVGAVLMVPFKEDYKRLNYDNEEGPVEGEAA
jgi:FLVCR family MFS transporter